MIKKILLFLGVLAFCGCAFARQSSQPGDYLFEDRDQNMTEAQYREFKKYQEYRKFEEKKKKEQEEEYLRSIQNKK